CRLRRSPHRHPLQTGGRRKARVRPHAQRLRTRRRPHVDRRAGELSERRRHGDDSRRAPPVHRRPRATDRRALKAPVWAWPCHASSSDCTVARSGSRAKSARVRGSRSRSRCAVANELILIVEDNPKNLKLVRDTLQVKGYQTIETETGEEGVQLAREQQPALVLMDIQLAGMSGVEAFRQIRADPMTRTIPVIAVTASERQKIMPAGFDGFQGKPISVRELLDTIRRLLDKSAAA